MKKYYLTKEVLKELIYGTQKNKNYLGVQLEELLKKNDSFYISLSSLEEILKAEESLEKRKVIFKNVNDLCDTILEERLDDTGNALSLQTEYLVDHERAMELTLASRYQLDAMLTISNRFDFQKMISVFQLVLKGK